MIGRAPEVEPRRFYVLSADIEAHGHEAAQDAQHLHRMEKRQSHTTMNAEKKSERSLTEPLTGNARMNAYKERIAETERVKEKKRARVE